MFGIDDAILGPLIGSAVGGLMGGSSQGGTQTQDRSPWAAAQPWLKDNIAQGQKLQNFYSANPFNSLQQGAYGNILAGNDYLNSAVPGLLSQFSQPVGFNRANPNARAPGAQMPAMQQMQQQGQQYQAPAMQPLSGLLGASMQQATSAPQMPAAQAPSYQPIAGPNGIPDTRAVNYGDPLVQATLRAQGIADDPTIAQGQTSQAAGAYAPAFFSPYFDYNWSAG